MATAINPGDEVFLDTSYALALSAPTDQLQIVASAMRAGQSLTSAMGLGSIAVSPSRGRIWLTSRAAGRNGSRL